MTQNRSSEELTMRDLIVPKLRARWPGARIVHELPLRHSSNRLDLGAITEEEIIAVEIKSSKDVADRLEAQIRAFKPISSTIIVAVAPSWWPEPKTVWMDDKRLGRVGRMEYGPVQKVLNDNSKGYIETWTVCAESGAIKTVRGDYGLRNEFPWYARQLEMLWREELFEIAFRHRIATHKRDPHADLMKAIAPILEGRIIQREVCRTLRARAAFGAASDPPIRLIPGPRHLGPMTESGGAPIKVSA